MYRRLVAGLAIMAVAGAALGGCKKETPEKTETVQTTPAPAPEPPPAPTAAAGESGKTGEELFNQHCAVCHPDGGNIIKPEKTLHKKDLAAAGISTPEDIVKTMRNPGPGMNKFDEATVPDQEAKAIGRYILDKF